jgi:hypothetical protein
MWNELNAQENQFAYIPCMIFWNPKRNLWHEGREAVLALTALRDQQNQRTDLWKIHEVVEERVG